MENKNVQSILISKKQYSTIPPTVEYLYVKLLMFGRPFEKYESTSSIPFWVPFTVIMYAPSVNAYVVTLKFDVL